MTTPGPANRDVYVSMPGGAEARPLFGAAGDSSAAAHGTMSVRWADMTTNFDDVLPGYSQVCAYAPYDVRPQRLAARAL